jgi:hypothetical protein
MEDTKRQIKHVRTQQSKEYTQEITSKASTGNLRLNLCNTKDNFLAGKTKLKFNEWKKITSDRWILQTICGYRVELDTKPNQINIPTPLQFSVNDSEKIDNEIKRFLDCGIIEPVTSSDKDEYISNIFARPKKDGIIRIILNLKQFNKSMQYIHFKM